MKDGSILIKKTCFKEPLIREKRKRLPSKRKVIVQKKIYVDVDWVEYLSSGDIITENCSHAWELLGGSVDRMICDLLRKVFYEYQKDSQIPKRVGLDY